jgi:hypothetical protein
MVLEVVLATPSLPTAEHDLGIARDEIHSKQKRRFDYGNES